jgi:calcineurin-like phosphoesterase family protein
MSRRVEKSANKMNTWFTSDTHFGHARIINYCKRPFGSVGEMDAALVAGWNARVQQDDIVYHLGDFTLFGDASFVRKYRERLAGKIHLIRGNHEKKSQDFSDIFASVSDLTEITVPIGAQHQRIVMCHYAMRVWPHSHRGAWHLYGHSHGTLSDDITALSIDVGVDCWEYAPVSILQIAARMAKKSWAPVDHHGRDDNLMD